MAHVILFVFIYESAPPPSAAAAAAALVLQLEEPPMSCSLIKRVPTFNIHQCCSSGARWRGWYVDGGGGGCGVEGVNEEVMSESDAGCWCRVSARILVHVIFHLDRHASPSSSLASQQSPPLHLPGSGLHPQPRC